MLADADGLTKAHAGEPGFAYSDQWAWQVGNIEGDILGETSKTCTVSPTDAGKRTKVKALFDDDTGNAQGPVKSDATVVVPTPIPGRGDVLVNNIGQTGSTSGSLGNLHHAQQFTIGSDTAGYALTTVEVHFTGAPNSVSVKVATAGFGHGCRLEQSTVVGCRRQYLRRVPRRQASRGHLLLRHGRGEVGQCQPYGFEFGGLEFAVREERNR